MGGLLWTCHGPLDAYIHSLTRYLGGISAISRLYPHPRHEADASSLAATNAALAARVDERSVKESGRLDQRLGELQVIIRRMTE